MKLSLNCDFTENHIANFRYQYTDFGQINNLNEAQIQLVMKKIPTEAKMLSS